MDEQVLYLKHRPTLFKHVVGQDDLIAALQAELKKGFPHAILLAGPSGCGKTTIARILASKLKCNPEMDLFELNCADFRGIDNIRDIRENMGLAAWGGAEGRRVYILDEFQSVTVQGMEASLKMLEDAPSHVYFMICTTNPDKLINTIKTRCTPYVVKLLEDKTMKELLLSVIAKEKVEVPKTVVARIVECADGSPRKALVLLNKIINMEGESNQLNAILSSDTKKQGIDLARLLMEPKVDWKSVATLLSSLEENVETIRHIVLTYAASVLLRGQKSARAYLIISSFESPFYESGRPGLIRACYEVSSSVSSQENS